MNWQWSVASQVLRIGGIRNWQLVTRELTTDGSCRYTIFLLLPLSHCVAERHWRHYAKESSAFGVGADLHAALAGGPLLDALCAVCRRRADHSLCWRHHGA